MASTHPAKALRLNDDEMALLGHLADAFHTSQSEVLRLGMAALDGLLRDGLSAGPRRDDSIYLTTLRRTFVRLVRQPDGSYRMAYEVGRSDEG